jgi:hypothetical protein
MNLQNAPERQHEDVYLMGYNAESTVVLVVYTASFFKGE